MRARGPTARHRRAERTAFAYLVFDAFEEHHERVGGRADTDDQTGDARQVERVVDVSAEQHQDRENHCAGSDQRQCRQQPEHPVVEQRVQQHQRQADRARDEAGPQRRQTQCGRDGFGLRGFERQRQRAVLQHVGQFRADSALNCPVICVRPPGMASWICGALTTCESSTNAVCVPTLAAVKSAQMLAALALELQGDDVLAALAVQPGTGVLDLLAADDRLVQQIHLLVVGRAGHQRQIRVVVAGQHVVLVAAGGLELQRQDLDLLLGALPQLLLVGDALRERLLLGGLAARAGAGGGARGSAAAARAGPASAGGSCGYGRGCGAGVSAGCGGTAVPGRPGRRTRRARLRAGGPARQAVRRQALPAARPAARLAGGCCGLALAGITWMTGPDVQPRRLAQVAGLAAVVARHRDHQVGAVDDDLGPGHAEAVDAGADDLLRLVERLAGGRASRRGCVRSA